MTFEEFFRKKRIDLDAMQKGDGPLFTEFKTHYQQMGEKSFDHTKKYWFNKLRKVYLLPPEIKTEKPRIDNPLAEQTITESLIDSAQAARPGFTPRFRAGAMAKPAPEAPAAGQVPQPTIPPEIRPGTPPDESQLPKPAYKPRFNSRPVPPKTGSNEQGL